MELKLPFKLKVKFLYQTENSFNGKAIFHEKDYSINIHAERSKNTIKVPFTVMGVTEDEILVRVSGPSGVYAEDHVSFNGSSEGIEIGSDSIFYEITNNQEKLDTLEIFVK